MTTKKQQEIVIPPHLRGWWREMKHKEDVISKRVEKALENLRKLGHDV